MTTGRISSFLIVTLLIACGHAFPLSKLRGDVFELKDGRKISGDATEYDQGKAYLVRIDDGVQVVLPKNEIKRHDRNLPSFKEYAEKAANLPQTVEAHVEMAAWCAKNGLVHHEKAHYERILDFEPNHEVARAALGYKRDKTNQWARVFDVMTEEQGKVKVGAKYRFPELVELEKAAHDFEVASKTRRKEIRRWHQEALSPGPRMAESRNKLHQISDELAIPALSELLLSKNTNDNPLKGDYVQLLRRFQNRSAAQALIESSMHDNDANVREACYDALKEYGKSIAVAAYKAYLRNDNPEVINRAAEGLAVMNDPTSILPLIDALESSHNRQINPGPGMNVGTSNGNGGLSMGGKAKNVVLKSQNQRVLGTLSQLTGVNFQYDKKEWLMWYARQHGAPVNDLRRDP